MSKEIAIPWMNIDGVAVADISEIEYAANHGNGIRLPNGEWFPSLRSLLNRCKTSCFHGEITHWEFPDGSVKIFND